MIDFFDENDIIGRLRVEGFTQEQIAEKTGLSRETVAKYWMLQNTVAPEGLKIARDYWEQRVVPYGTSVFEFTKYCSSPVESPTWWTKTGNPWSSIRSVS